MLNRIEKEINKAYDVPKTGEIFKQIVENIDDLYKKYNVTELQHTPNTSEELELVSMQESQEIEI